MKSKKSSEIKIDNSKKLVCISCKNNIKEKGICPYCGVRNK